MLFTQLEFLVFFVAVFLCAWLVPGNTVRKGLLLVASYYFYAYWDYRFLALILFSTVVDFAAGMQIYASSSPRVRRAWLLISLCSNFGLLGFFKYFNFFIDSASAVFQPLGWSIQTLNIVLPVGISFYTFQTLSYTIDIYRRQLEPTRSSLDFALYVAFFPQLVAGPIVRAVELLPQLASRPAWDAAQVYDGFQQALRGVLKKVLLADRLGELVDVVFAGPELYSGATVWLAVLGYAGQIYYDFSGYSDMAIGFARMLGYEFPINFRHPYLATSIQEFWRRWHITLSTWLRDYLYFSLGGSRCKPARIYFNLMVTMLLGGLWHGAAWTFVLWGALHGLALCVERRIRATSVTTRNEAPGAAWLLARWAITMAIVVIAWIPFRAGDMQTTAIVVRQLFAFDSGIAWFPPLPIAVLLIMVIEHLLWLTPLRGAMRLPYDRWYTPVLTAIALWCLLVYAPQGFQPFVYFQF